MMNESIITRDKNPNDINHSSPSSPFTHGYNIQMNNTTDKKSSYHLSSTPLLRNRIRSSSFSHNTIQQSVQPNNTVTNTNTHTPYHNHTGDKRIVSDIRINTPSLPPRTPLLQPKETKPFNSTKSIQYAWFNILYISKLSAQLRSAHKLVTSSAYTLPRMITHIIHILYKLPFGSYRIYFWFSSITSTIIYYYKQKYQMMCSHTNTHLPVVSVESHTVQPPTQSVYIGYSIAIVCSCIILYGIYYTVNTKTFVKLNYDKQHHRDTHNASPINIVDTNTTSNNASTSAALPYYSSSATTSPLDTSRRYSSTSNYSTIPMQPQLTFHTHNNTPIVSNTNVIPKLFMTTNNIMLPPVINHNHSHINHSLATQRLAQLKSKIQTAQQSTDGLSNVVSPVEDSSENDNDVFLTPKSQSLSARSPSPTQL